MLSETIEDAYDMPGEVEGEDLATYASEVRKAWNRLVDRIKALPRADGGDPNLPQVPPPPPQ